MSYIIPVGKSSSKKDSYKIYKFESDIIKNKAATRNQIAIRDEQKELSEWSEYYFEDLKTMYNACVDSDLDLSYSKFVELAFKCSQSNFDSRKLKYLRPLI